MATRIYDLTVSAEKIGALSAVLHLGAWMYLFSTLSKFGHTWWRSWCRHFATSWKVGIFHWDHPSGSTTAVVSTQPITEISTRNIYFLTGRGGVLGYPVRRADNFATLTHLRTGLLNCLNARSRGLTFRHRASFIWGQAFRYSPENAFYIFNQQIYFIIWYLLDGASLI